MKAIFALTKSEQRVVIVIVSALVAGAVAKYEWNAHWQLRPTKPMPTPAITPQASTDNESAPADEAQ
jgi:hypothetical protein